MNYSNAQVNATTGYTSGISTPGVIKDRPPSQVQEQVQRGARILSAIEEKMKALFDRLQPVLQITPSGQGEANPKPTLVGHAMALSNHNDQLEMIDSQLADILNRIEL